MLGHVTLVSHALGTLHFARRKKAKVFLAYKIYLNLPWYLSNFLCCSLLLFPKLATQSSPHSIPLNFLGMLLPQGLDT